MLISLGIRAAEPFAFLLFSFSLLSFAFTCLRQWRKALTKNTQLFQKKKKGMERERQEGTKKIKILFFVKKR